MKRYVCFIVIIILLMSTSCTFINMHDEEFFTELYKLNTSLKDYNFQYADISEDDANTLLLYNKQRSEIYDNSPFASITVSDVIANKVLYIYCNKDCIYFVTSAWIDDESGYVFPDNNGKISLDSLYSIKRMNNTGVPQLFYFENFPR